MVKKEKFIHVIYYMNKEGKKILKGLIFLFIIYLFILPGYNAYLPTLPVYDNKEADIVKKMVDNRTEEDINYFKLTNISVAYAFEEHVEESADELREMYKHTVPIIYTIKYLINRPRPYQIDESIDYIDTETGRTPAMPAGHAYQAYYLEKILSKKYPEKKEKFSKIAKKCDDCRVKAGIHYPSDGKLSKKLVDIFYFYI